MFKLEISTENDAFTPYAAPELARILRVLAERIEEGHTDGPARDVNGNRCGVWSIED